ncbi:MAG TPA: hypothetical protein VLA34_02475, partial [Candidatus Krumholzibacterium sp.]|nr:hypothetical protein [Candidatus Krumholzibacterium sp.]
GISMVLPHRYISAGAFLPAGIEKELSGGDNFFSGLGSLGETYATFVRVRRNFVIDYVVRSRKMAGLMAERFDLKEIYGKDKLDDAWSELRERTSMVVRDEGVLVIAVEDSDPVRARDMVAAYIELTDRLLAEWTMENARSRRDFLENERSRREKVIAGLDAGLAGFMEENGLFGVQEQARAAYQLLAGLAARESALELQRQMYEHSMREGNLELDRLDRELAIVRDRVGKIVHEEGGGALFPPLDSMPALSAEYLGMISERMIQEFALAFVKVKLIDADLAANRDVSVIRVIDPPYVPEIRSWPRRKQIVLVSTFAALFWICFGLFVRERWPYLTSSGDVRRTEAEDGG